ncbi:MAG: sigma-70 family RNA polymerase sigma factor [Lachnospiraceae bacterium]|nr:sigma-70 family RNA polymerase sigma factor [Lachnospiraceae bacterium]
MSDRKITIKSGNEEFTLEVTEEEYQRYYRPWWSQRKREQRNREAMEQNGYTEESYEAWKDNASEEVGIPDMELPGMDELVEKKLLLGVLADAMDSLLPEERELAMRVFGEEMQVSEFAKMHGQPRTTVSSKKTVVLGKLRAFFREKGLDV